MNEAAWRIFRVVIALVLLVGLPTSLLLERTLSANLIDRIEADLVAQAALAHSMASQAAPTELDALADQLGDASGARFTYIAPDGRVLGDSWIAQDALADVENHADRPEIREARLTGKGVARRTSQTTDTDFLYVAVARPDATVRAAMPLTQVNEAVRRLRATLATAGVLAFAMAILGSWMAARLVNRDFEALRDEARQLAAETPEEPPAGEKAADATEETEEEDEDEDDDSDPGPPLREPERLEDELGQAVRALADQRDLVRAVLDGISDGVVSLGRDDRVETANAAALSLLGWKKVPKGKRFSKRVPAALAEHLAEVREYGPTQAELTLGRQVVEVSSAELSRAGGLVLVLRDITDLRRLERVRRDFVANVSHELGTPIAVIRANTETLLDGGALDDPKGRKLFTEAIDRQAHRLSALVADLLQISRIEAGELPLDLEPVDLAEAFADVIESTAPDAARRDVTVTAEPTDVTVFADARALHSILENLVSNAIKYGDRRVVLSADSRKGRTRVYVRDDGPGIAPEHRDRVFERFYRVDKGRSREVGGTGLGLSIVRNLAHAMGGEVGVKEAPEGGAAFFIEL